MLASLAEALSGWAFPGKKRRPDSPGSSSSGRVSAAAPTAEPQGSDDESDRVAPIPEDASGDATPDRETRETSASAAAEVAEDDSAEDDSAEDLGIGLRHTLDTGIERLMTLYPATGKEPDAQDVLTMLMHSAMSNIRQPPAAARAVLSLCQRRHHSFLELTDLIERDPSLSEALLRHANSAFYATPGGLPVAGLRAAIQRVGTNGVHAAVMSRIIQGVLSPPGARFARPARMVWDHMVRVAPIARRLARPFEVDAETAFSLGLLHDVGKLVFFHHVATLRRTRRREIVISEDFLKAALAALHQPIGGLAVLEWGLDEQFAYVVANHHRFPKPVPEDIRTEVVFLAERIDLAEQRGEILDIEPLWDDAALTGPRTAVRDLISARTEGTVSSTPLA